MEESKRSYISLVSSEDPSEQPGPSSSGHVARHDRALYCDIRKRRSDETYDRPSKSSKAHSSSLPSCWTYQELGRKRKSDEVLTESKRSKISLVSSEDPSEQPGPSSAGHVTNDRAAFEAKYEEGMRLGAGAYGRVHAGIRRDDGTPVAIKHIGNSFADYLYIRNEMIPAEVFLTQKVQPAPGQSSAVITLLDWYRLELEVVLVLERPLPCRTLWQYLLSKGGFLAEDEAKIIVRQLVDALIDLHSKGVCHEDIKLPNLLVETGSDVPRVRIIDFGCGTLLTKDKETEYVQYFTDKVMAEIKTARQIGEVAFTLLYGHMPFTSRIAVLRGHFPVQIKVSLASRIFLERLFTFDDRPLTLESLKNDPWLM